MSIIDLVFLVTAGVTIFASLGVVISKNIVHSALYLVLSFLGVATIYFQLSAAFLGLVQIMIYAGAISVLIIFAIMLVIGEDVNQSNPSTKKGTLIGVIAAGLFTFLVSISVVSSNWTNLVNNVLENPVGDLAQMLMGDYVIAFEVAAILLLVAIVGAIMIAKGAEQEND
ncbi:MAG TPA: NADH-quinone oxidoreductase subunit J [Syntrophomonadaceae bacterium]|nr:NADH-quinone oxidoreductase subunit J [Syntrophomonadaceae bacterium]